MLIKDKLILLQQESINFGSNKELFSASSLGLDGETTDESGAKPAFL